MKKKKTAEQKLREKNKTLRADNKVLLVKLSRREGRILTLEREAKDLKGTIGELEKELQKYMDDLGKEEKKYYEATSNIYELEIEISNLKDSLVRLVKSLK